MVCISVIVPVYNCEDYLEESLGSILNQTFNDIEIICIDDGSTDDSLRILRKMASSDSRIEVFAQENKGAGAVRNYGMTKALGDYVYFFDADDFLENDALEKAYENAKRNDSDIVFFKFDQYKTIGFSLIQDPIWNFNLKERILTISHSIGMTIG